MPLSVINNQDCLGGFFVDYEPIVHMLKAVEEFEKAGFPVKVGKTYTPRTSYLKLYSEVIIKYNSFSKKDGKYKPEKTKLHISHDERDDNKIYYVRTPHLPGYQRNDLFYKHPEAIAKNLLPEIRKYQHNKIEENIRKKEIHSIREDLLKKIRKAIKPVKIQGTVERYGTDITNNISMSDECYSIGEMGFLMKITATVETEEDISAIIPHLVGIEMYLRKKKAKARSDDEDEI